MNLGKLVFAQVTQHLPLTTFRRCVARYGGAHKVKSFSCLDQYLCMAFAQLTYRDSLRDIEACLRAQAASCTTWASRAGFRAALWPMPTRIVTGPSTPTLLSRSLPSPVVFTPQSPLASTSKIRSMLWMPAPQCVDSLWMRGGEEH